MDRKRLLVKNLPQSLSIQDRESLLKRHGALEVLCFPDNGLMRRRAYATFANDNQTQDALRHLHQLEVLGSRLCVEYAKPQSVTPMDGINDKRLQTSQAQLPKSSLDASRLPSTHAPLNQLTSEWPTLIKYDYPNATPRIVKRIATQLLESPQFYAQVLHLMSKMNMPSPLVARAEEDDAPQIESDIRGAEDVESELEAEIRESVSPTRPALAARKRQLKVLQSGLLGDKPQKRQRVVSSSQNYSSVANNFGKEQKNEVFVINRRPQKPAIYISRIEQVRSTDTTYESTEGGFGIISKLVRSDEAHEQVKPEDPELDVVFPDKVLLVSDEELRLNVLSAEARQVNPVFRNYNKGAPCATIYIKNLAKQVTEDDLKRIYLRYVGDSHEALFKFHIQLMTRGRMKGQAFVTFLSSSLALKAIDESNGYVLKGKPIVAVFAKSATRNSDGDDEEIKE